MTLKIYINEWLCRTFDTKGKNYVDIGDVLSHIFVVIVALGIAAILIMIIGMVGEPTTLTWKEYLFSGIYRIISGIILIAAIVIFFIIGVHIASIKIAVCNRYTQEPFSELLTMAQGIKEQGGTQ